MLKSKTEILNLTGKSIRSRNVLHLDHWLRPKLSKKLAKKSVATLLKKNLTIAFVDRATSRKLNLKHRKRNYATDVLSFAPIEDSSMGELVFCYQVIQRQAREHSLRLRDELAYMFIHGLLHLLGFEHEKSQKQARRMFEIQDFYFEAYLKSLKKPNSSTSR